MIRPLLWGRLPGKEQNLPVVPETPTARRGRGRRPAAEVRAGVLEAAARLLHDQGVAAVTFERVAALAGSSKTTLYKWWPSAGALAAEAFFVQSESELNFPDTGDIKSDLTTQLCAFVDLLTTGGAGAPIAGLVGAAQADPDLARAWSINYTKPRRELAIAALERARARGQIRRDVDLHSVVDQLWGACYYRLLVPDQPLDADFAEILVSNLLLGISPRR